LSTAKERDWIPARPVAFARAVSRPHARWALGATLAVLLATAASRLMTYTLKLLTDAAIAFGDGRGDATEIWRSALVFPGVYLANELVWRTSGFCGMRWITGAVAEASQRLFGYLSDHSATYFSDRYAGALINKIANATSGTERLIAQWLWQFFPWIAELLQPHEIVDRPGATPLVVTSARIRFEALDFSYKNARVFAGDFELEVAGGEKLGLVGHSGAGKSTLVSLLLRQFELHRGSIRIDGQSVSDITLESLRRAVALVPQSASLFHRSIMDNIRYGRLAASDEDVVEAARLAEADSFIRQLPQGYSTRVGERGVKLSGGQRQRVAIARALLRRAPILLLDEATSALDSESEAAIQAALVGLMHDKTVIAIAHRLSTLRAMDRIVVVEQGRIVEDGSHEALVRQGGVYASLWNSQVSGFIPD